MDYDLLMVRVDDFICYINQTRFFKTQINLYIVVSRTSPSPTRNSVRRRGPLSINYSRSSERTNSIARTTANILSQRVSNKPSFSKV